MEKDKIFFGESGLTQTSANFVANLAKELYSGTESVLNNMVFYSTTIQLIGSNEKSMVREGLHSIAEVPEAMEMIARLKSLISWMREAIKAKERLIKEAQNSTYSDYDIEIPEEPNREEYITSDDVVAGMSIKERNRYYYLEAFCATIGEYIHPNGVYAVQRDELKKVISEPNKVAANGRDTLIYNRAPSLNPEEVENTFMQLQQTYREYQAELNSIKYQIQDTVNKDTAKKNIEYSQKMSDYRTQMSLAEALLVEKRKEAVDKASSLKIIIPDSLKGIYERVQALGKK